MEIAEKILGALANIFEVAAVLAAALVFLTSRESTQRISKSILSAAVWAASNGWLVWLKRGSAVAYAGFERLYGPREAAGKLNFRGYLTKRSLGVSFRLTAIYLTLGVPLLLLLGAIIYGFIAASEKPGRLVNLMLFTMLVCTALAAAVELKKANKTEPVKSNLNGLVYSLQFGLIIPLFLILLVAAIFGRDLENYAGVVTIGIVLPLCFYSVYRAIKVFCFSFGVYVPVAVVFFVLLSSPVIMNFVVSASIILKQTNDELGATQFISLLALCAFAIFGALFLKMDKNSRARSALLVAYHALIVICFLMAKKFSENTIEYLFKTNGDGFSVFSISVMPGVIMAILISVVYANAICDWVSVGVTRYMTLITSKVRGGLGYAVLILADCALAALFFAMTMTIFVAMTHLYLAVALVPGEKFLSSMADTIVASDVWMIPNPPLKELQLSGAQLLGQASAAFVKVFALTALLPTLFHMLMIVAFALIKATGRLVHAPAKALSQRLDEAMMDGGGSLLGLHRVVYGGFVFTTISVSLAIAYVLFALAN